VQSDILDAYVTPPPSPERARKLEKFEQWAKALATTRDAVEHQYQHERPLLAARLKAVGIDPWAGRPADAGAPSEPVEARDDIGTTADTTADDEPAEGNVGARGDEAFERAADAARLLPVG
jgi:hypothetical protein